MRMLTDISLCLLLPALLHAEIVDQSPAQLVKQASHIAVGKVLRIYKTQERNRGYEVTRRVAEVRVDRVTKGGGLTPGKIVFVRYWTQRWVRRDMPPPGTKGHRGLPAVGDTVQVYLKRVDDGGLDVIFPNGFGKAKAAKQGDAKKTKKSTGQD